MMPDLYFNNVPGTGAIIRTDQGAGAGATRDFLKFQKNATEVFSVDYTGLPDPGGNQQTRFITIQVGDIAADSDALKNFLVEFRAGITIAATGCDFCVDTNTATGVGGNTQTLTIKRSSDDGTVVAVTTSASNPAVAQATWTTMGAVTNGAIAAGEYLYITFTKASAGLALSGLSIQIKFTMTS